MLKSLRATLNSFFHWARPSGMRTIGWRDFRDANANSVYSWKSCSRQIIQADSATERCGSESARKWKKRQDLSTRSDYSGLDD